MIKSFRHRVLQRFFEDGEVGKINADHAAKLARILDRLEASTGPRDMDLPGYRLHQLKGDRKGEWAVWVSANWRVTFRFEGPDAVDVDYCDYHLRRKVSIAWAANADRRTPAKSFGRT